MRLVTVHESGGMQVDVDELSPAQVEGRACLKCGDRGPMCYAGRLYGRMVFVCEPRPRNCVRKRRPGAESAG